MIMQRRCLVQAQSCKIKHLKKFFIRISKNLNLATGISESVINALGKRGAVKFADLTFEVISECLMEAQEYASRNASFLGTKGIITANT